MVAEMLVKGLAAGAWVVGFVLSVGVLVFVMWLFCTVMGWLCGKDDEEKRP